MLFFKLMTFVDGITFDVQLQTLLITCQEIFLFIMMC